MENKDEEKKIDSKSSWAQVVKSGQLKAPSTLSAATSTSGSSFAGAASGGAWGSSGAVVGGAWGSSESNQRSLRPVLPALAFKDSVQVRATKIGTGDMEAFRNK